jgi:hypothetical protein
MSDGGRVMTAGEMNLKGIKRTEGLIGMRGCRKAENTDQTGLSMVGSAQWRPRMPPHRVPI